MLKTFRDDETGYLAWVQTHPDGYVVNIDEPPIAPQYPMVHIASHRIISSPTRTNYTTGRYFKVCSTELEELERWAQRKYGRPLTRCRQCLG
jgi:hypothetical protein